jgi:hypothetical protein
LRSQAQEKERIPWITRSSSGRGGPSGNPLACRSCWTRCDMNWNISAACSLPLRRSWQQSSVPLRESSHIHRFIRQYLSAHIRQKLFSCLLPLCYRNTPTLSYPARSRLLRFLVFLPSYMLLNLLSLVSRASLNQRAVGSTPTRPTKINHLHTLPLPADLRVGTV